MSTKAAASNSNGRHVLLTGSTGFVGSYTLYALLQRKEIKRVTCLNRSGGDQTNAWIQQFPNYEPTVKFKHLQADLTQPDFGLSADVYSELLDSVTDILHCQWAVDFNRPLDYFEPNIKGVSSLIHFTHAAKHAIHFIFLSSVGTVRNWDQPNAVPEERLTSPSIAGTGYGASKLIASLLLDKVGQSVGIRSSICRLGQVAGPIQYLQKRKHSQHQKPELDHTRAWPLRDWFPTLLTSSIDIGCLPDTLGFANEIDWLPVDFVGEILSDLVCNLDLDASRCVDHSGHGHAGTDGFLTKYYHLVNPHRTQYSDMVQFLAGRLGRPDALKVVSLQEWVSLLTDLALGSSGIRSQSSGIGLLGFFQGLADSSYLNPLILDTRKTEQQLPRLVSLGSVSEHWLDMWLEQWGLMKTRGGKQMLED
ncbi:Male sterility NAD-binding [Penicillium verhagenii]|uniref:Male sterility NAD-binding n=1 Tax=Penicillium verhagenii TaxID=1562060 RepID=UPI002545A5FE|nr:Male sterility NAD-binding [Penicillium verhagenii]KAJ5918436.1 Male sterility NAD-binding [Penicillium verhagenii]